MSNSEEEEIARNFICFGHPDVTVLVVDATSLERNLNLVYQTMEITKNIIVCVNLLDEAKKKGISVDLDKLSNSLGVPVVGTIATKKKTLSTLLDTIIKVCKKEIIINPKKVNYSTVIESGIKTLNTTLKKEFKKIPNYYYRFISLKLIDGDEKILDSIEHNFKINLKNNKNLLFAKEKVLNTISSNFENSPEYLNKNKDFSFSDCLKDEIVSTIIEKSELVSNKVCSKKSNYSIRDQRIDKLLTSKAIGFPIMILLLSLIFWITIVGANYPSQMLFTFFDNIKEYLINFSNMIHLPKWISSLLINGVYQTLTWVISVMLPPMAIFFPLFTFLEDLGYLPRIAFNMDGFFKKACCSGKQMITMCMGFGCNCAGVVGCRIINSPRERLIAILTNSLVPCNGRFPILISVATIFIAGSFHGFTTSIISTLSVMVALIISIFFTLLISKLLSKTILKGFPSSFVLELPPYRKPQTSKILVRSIFDRTLFILGRAISVAAPAGLIIWILANITIGNQSILNIFAQFLNPFAQLMGLDGYILTAFILGLPANEIVFPIMLMCYLNKNSLIDVEDTLSLGNILIQNGWNLLTAINVMLFTCFHFPCATTLLTIKKETNSLKWTALSFLIPTILGIVLCMITTLIYNILI